MYEVGKFYRVPCVKTTKEQRVGRGAWVPVIGPKHEDAEFVGFPDVHWHIDWRFVADEIFAQETALRSPKSAVFGSIVMESTKPHEYFGPSRALTTEFKVRRIKCRRTMPTYPNELVARGWGPKLNAAYKDCRMQNMTCPHRGLPLDGCETHGDVVTCPGHGLRWNVKTGELVTDGIAERLA